MATFPIQVNINGQIYEGTGTVPTARIPELPEAVLPLEATDQLAVFRTALNSTRHITLDTIRSYMNGTTGGQPETPVLNGDTIEIPITEANAGYQVNVPQLIGKSFKLIRRSVGPLTTGEYVVLPSGGFEILEPNPPATIGEVFFAEVYEISINNPGTTAAGFITGIASITSSTALSSIHFNKLIHVIGNAAKVVVTLPDITEASPLNLIVPIETNISNTQQTRIVAKNGQSIYFGNTSQPDIYLGISSRLWLMAGTDGWYVIEASNDILNVGQPFFDYTQRLNTIVATGQSANRADYPRLMKFLQDNPSIWVSETQWLTELPVYPGATDVYFPYKGLFSKGNDSTTFRFPDLQDMAFAGLKTIGGLDADRVSNIPGTIQPDMLRKHAHPIEYGLQGSDGSPNMQGLRISPTDNSEGNGAGVNPTAIQDWGQTKTRMTNAGFLPLIRI